MEANTLLEKLKKYGADINGINDRFMGDMVLYSECLSELMKEKNLAVLEESMAAENYDSAFEAAHALKGLSGNLGLMPFYNAICKLTDSLRSQKYRNVKAEYASVVKEITRLEDLTGEKHDSSVSVTADSDDAEADASRNITKSTKTGKIRKGKRLSFKSNILNEHRKINLITITIVATLLVIAAVIGGVFFALVREYQVGISSESANHLIDINNQIKQNIEVKISEGWKVVGAIKDSISRLPNDYSEERVKELMSNRRDIWQMTDLYLYTDAGYAINADGEKVSVDYSTEIAPNSRSGEFMQVNGSMMIYASELTHDFVLSDANVIAVAAFYDMTNFFEDMQFSSFDGAAYAYLAQADGAIISRYTHGENMLAEKMSEVLDGHEYTNVGVPENTFSDLMTSNEIVVLLMNADSDDSNYVVATPIDGDHGMRLFYFAPATSVNATMNTFSRKVTFLSAAVILSATLIVLSAFAFLYSMKKKQFMATIFERERTLDMMVKHTQMAFAMFALSQREPIYVSQNTKDVLGVDYISLEQKDDGSFEMLNNDGSEDEAILQLNEDLTSWDGKSMFISSYIPRKTELDTEYYVVELYPANDDYSEYVGIAQDVTNAYLRERATRDALAMAERSNAAKSRFLSNMSHDIRTPMNAILNMTDFALDSFAAPAKQKEYLKTIRKSSEHLLHLINDVLDMSRIESGQAVIESENFDIKSELTRIVDIVQPLCDAKQLNFIVEYDEVEETGVIGDQVKVSQILLNLLSNAIKFTPPKGVVRFTISELPSLRKDMIELRFTVEDTGIGIPSAFIDTIFEPFTRADDKRVSGIEGSGLGLSICKSYVDAMGGVIKCVSEENYGSTFTVELFFQKVESDAKNENNVVDRGEKPFLGKRCLVCEDNAINQVIAKTILERLGFTVELAADGQEGANKFNLSLPGYFDIIYMDIQMPIMDGYQAAAAIREGSHTQAQDIPIIAMTANVFAEDIEKARIAGMNGHIGKPIIISDLTEETYKQFNP